MHKTTQALFDYWTEIRGQAPCPSRAAIEPRMIARHLAETFLLTVDSSTQLPYRLAGTRVCGLFGHELKDLSFAAHFSAAQREDVMRLVKAQVADRSAVLLFARGQTENGRTVPLEILLMPIAGTDGTINRLIGTMAVGDSSVVSEANPVETIVLLGVQMLTIAGVAAPASAPPPTPPLARGHHLRLVVSREA